MSSSRSSCSSRAPTCGCCRRACSTSAPDRRGLVLPQARALLPPRAQRTGLGPGLAWHKAGGPDCAAGVLQQALSHRLPQQGWQLAARSSGLPEAAVPRQMASEASCGRSHELAGCCACLPLACRSWNAFTPLPGRSWVRVARATRASVLACACHLEGGAAVTKGCHGGCRSYHERKEDYQKARMRILPGGGPDNSPPTRPMGVPARGTPPARYLH